ncbi:MAG: beta-CASP ribonuclease aCPSF1 [Nanoarchaeota archaeon]|nr:beta-CASP ribonuclease aCPSF1 [Nanoarchaeota archaeon]
MANIIEEILKELPSEAKISDTYFEGANIILYTTSKDFFINKGDVIRKVVSSIKKRIELRPDPSLCMEIEKAEKEIRKIAPEEAGVSNIIFDPQRSVVIIEAEKPGSVIGKQGELLREIKEKTLWVPIVKRSPALKSQIIENIRGVLYQNNDYRKKFLNKVGHRIYDGWTKKKKEEWVRVTMLGAGRQVGRSAVLVQTPESNILLDCGINPGIPEGPGAYPMLDGPEFKLSDLDAVILSHAHTDHSGFIPFLYKMGYRGPVYCTAPTRDISALLALDSIGVSFKQAKKNLFDIQDVKEMVKHTITLDWEEVTDITPDIRLTLYNSGHILGSSMTHLNVGNGLHNFLYTADMKYLKTRTLDPAHTKFPRLETVMIESTYGARDKVLGSRKKAEDDMIKIIEDTAKKGGKILIPVLGVGRAQEVLLVVESAIREGRMKKIPVYVQGMVWDITAIHTAYPDFMNRDLRRAIFHKDENPFLSDLFKKVGSKKEQDQIMESNEPCILISTAGMLNAGASLEYFKKMADNPKNSLIFVTYQGQGTLGRRIQDGERKIIFNEEGRAKEVEVRLGIYFITDFTGHAGRGELIKFIKDLEPRPKKVIVQHGESSGCLDLASSLHKLYRIETVAPKNLEGIRLK